MVCKHKILNLYLNPSISCRELSEGYIQCVKKGLFQRIFITDFELSVWIFGSEALRLAVFFCDKRMNMFRHIRLEIIKDCLIVCSRITTPIESPNQDLKQFIAKIPRMVYILLYTKLYHQHKDH